MSITDMPPVFLKIHTVIFLFVLADAATTKIFIALNSNSYRKNKLKHKAELKYIYKKSNFKRD
jgi:hypothetical protein